MLLEALVQTLKLREPPQKAPAKSDLEIYDIKLKQYMLCMFVRNHC
jgi:hypothetical protein